MDYLPLVRWHCRLATRPVKIATYRFLYTFKDCQPTDVNLEDGRYSGCVYVWSYI